MEREPGDDYVRRMATFVRTNELALAQGGLRRRRPRPKQSEASMLNPLSWIAFDTNPTPVKPITLTLDLHRLFYLLMRIEGLGIDVGSLDVRVDRPARPMNYINVFPNEKASDAISISSLRSSFSGISKLSLGGGWFSKAAPPALDTELKYLYSSFTKLPALILRAPGPKVISELADDRPNENALPLYAFKTLEVLECLDIDPRVLLGWDRLADSLRSLTIKRSGIEDVTDIFVGAVLDDLSRLEETSSRQRHRRIASRTSFYGSALPDAVHESEAESEDHDDDPGKTPTVPEKKLPGSKWAFLRHLSLADNALTFIATAPLEYLTSVTHLDLSSNLLVSVPPGLSALYSLVSLNLSDNMIDSVLGIYTQLGSVLSLNLSSNRLESLCGLERLAALESVDIRHNQVEESAEVGRLAVLPNIREMWVEGNPLTELEEHYRVRCFDYFWKEGKSVLLDGTPAGFYEKQYMSAPPPEQMTSSRPMSAAYSPPIVAVGSPARTPAMAPASGPTTSSNPNSSPASNVPSPGLGPSAGPGARGRKKRNKRIVDLDGTSHVDGDARSRSGSRPAERQANSESVAVPKAKTRKAKLDGPGSPKAQEIVFRGHDAPPLPEEPVAVASEPQAGPSSPPSAVRPKPKSRHSRYGTEFGGPQRQSTLPEDVAAPLPDEAPRKSATLTSRAAKRRARMSASVFEQPAREEPVDTVREADAYRARIEALRSDMGDGWLKAFNAGGLSPRTPPPVPMVGAPP